MVGLCEARKRMQVTVHCSATQVTAADAQQISTEPEHARPCQGADVTDCEVTNSRDD